MRRAWLFGVALACVAWGARADVVSITGTAEGGERLIFEWPAPVRYTAQRIDNRLIITFARRIEADLSGLVSKMPGVIKGARIAADGRTVVIELEKAVRLRTEVKDNTVIVDLTDRASPPAAQARAPS